MTLAPLILLIPSLFANHTATVTRSSGEVYVYKVQGKGTQIRFEGRDYFHTRGEIGATLENGDVLRTGVKGRAHLTFDNGDQMKVGPQTIYEYKVQAQVPAVTLRFGKLRSIVNKKGPRRRFTVKTKNSTMGVRGTDFFVVDRGLGRTSQVNVLRGKVAMASNDKPKKPTVIKAGEKGTLPAPSEKLSGTVKTVYRPTIQKKKISAQEAVAMQKTTAIRRKPKLKGKKKTKVEKLEKKALNNVLEDIKEAQPDLAKSLPKNIRSVDEVNQQVVRKVYEEAPQDPKEGPRKPFLEELEALVDQDPYERYFKDR